MIRTGETEFHPDITADELDELEANDELRETIAKLDLRSTIAVPLRKRDASSALYSSRWPSRSRRYTSDDVALAQSVADRIASSIENLRLYELQRDIARTLQRSLLPPTLPDDRRHRRRGALLAGRGSERGRRRLLRRVRHSSVRVTGRWSSETSAAPVPQQPHSPAWRGTRSARAPGTATARPTCCVRSTARCGTRPHERSSPPSTRPSTPLVLVPTLTVTCGGHPLPIHVDGRTKAAVTMGSPGTLLGMVDTIQFTTETRHLDSGDVLVFYTDGATDVHPPHDIDGDRISRTRAPSGPSGRDC